MRWGFVCNIKSSCVLLFVTPCPQRARPVGLYCTAGSYCSLQQYAHNAKYTCCHLSWWLVRRLHAWLPVSLPLSLPLREQAPGLWPASLSPTLHVTPYYIKALLVSLRTYHVWLIQVRAASLWHKVVRAVCDDYPGWWEVGGGGLVSENGEP